MAELMIMLESMVVLKASDLYINAGAPPTFKVNGELRVITEKPLEPDHIHKLVTAVLDDEQRQRFENQMELDISLQLKKGGRFRLNIYRQKGSLALVARHIKDVIPSIDELRLPVLLKDMVMAKQGLILVVGGTGVGKSTTLASMVDYRNEHQQGHILTVEDPIEFVHYHKKSLVSQREIGVDTQCYSDALKYALREAPDVIVIGEIRDADTAKQALRFAETGHLCLATLHATSASSALDRLVNFFPPDAHHQVHQDLAFHLYGVVAQRLAKRIDGGRVPAVEILVNNAYIAALIEKGDTTAIRQAMAQDASDNCQTFDDAIYQLVVDGIISKEEASRLTDSQVDFSLRFRLSNTHTAVRVFHNKHDWLAPNADFSQYQRIAAVPKRVSKNFQANLEALLLNGIQTELRMKGYEVNSNNPDLLLKFSFDLHTPTSSEITSLDEFGESLNRDATAESGLAIQVSDPETGSIVWKVTATGPGEKLRFSEQDVQEELSSLLANFPERTMLKTTAKV